jgi:hypothetical protein
MRIWCQIVSHLDRWVTVFLLPHSHAQVRLRKPAAAASHWFYSTTAIMLGTRVHLPIQDQDQALFKTCSKKSFPSYRPATPLDPYLRTGCSFPQRDLSFVYHKLSFV